MKTVTENSMQKKKYTVNVNKSPTEKINILMVDDHPENLLALEAVLSSPNYNLVSATSGKEALKCMLKQDFAVILLDVQMPGLNGFETAKLIKMREKTKYIPIIFITAISQDMEHVLQGYSVGAIDYIFKPFEPETLRRKMEQFVKIHEKHQESLIQNDWERSVELNKVNKELDRASLNLRRSEALSNVISETIIDSIVTFDFEGKILSVNPAVKNMFGYGSKELIGESIAKLFQNRTDEKEMTSPYFIFTTLKEAVGKVIEFSAVHKNGQTFPSDIQIGETAVEGEQIFVCTIRDVSERKQIEQVKKQQLKELEMMVQERTVELTEANKNLQKEVEERKKLTDHLMVSEERFRKIFHSSPILKAIYSLKDGQYLEANSTWEHVTGYKLVDLKIENLDVLMMKDEYDDAVILNQSIHNKKVFYLTKDGEKRAALLSTEKIDLYLEPCMLIVLIDITERVQMEKEMSRLDRLNLIGEMAAGIAHEIRNPMTTVHGFLQVARNNNEQIADEIIDLMLEELNRANYIITEFLNLAKNKVSVKKKQNINAVINALYPLIHAEALRSSKNVLLDLSECPNIAIDEKEIRQIILNMALNGLDAMSVGGELTIKTYEEKDTVTLEIKDQGKGISQEVLEKIGTPFFTTKEKGTGLGLAICFSVAKRHHATIDIETGDKGTTFFIRFQHLK